MADDEMQPNANDRTEQGKPEPKDRETQQSQASAATPLNQRVAPGRMPLFRR